MSTMKTVRRNSKHLVAIFANVKNVRCFTLENHFSGKPGISEGIKHEFEAYDFTKLSTNGAGKFTMRVHSNCWYEFESVALDPPAATAPTTATVQS